MHLKTKIKGMLLVAAILVIMLFCLPLGTLNARADSYDFWDDEVSFYSFTIEKYNVEMQIEADYTVHVKEQITAHFEGIYSHGIIRDLRLGGGVRYQDIKASCDNPDFSPYFETEDAEVLSIYLRGSRYVTGMDRTYTLTYTMLLPALDEGYLPLDIIGYDWDAEINNVTVTLTVPDGLGEVEGKDYNIYSGRAGTTKRGDVTYARSGNTIVLTAETLPKMNGITFDMQFQAGALTPQTDNLIFYALGIAAALVAVAVLLKLLWFRQPQMVWRSCQLPT